MNSPHFPVLTPGILSGLASRQTPPRGASRTARFVTQSHALGGPVASPKTLVIATAIAIVVYLIGCRLSE